MSEYVPGEAAYAESRFVVEKLRLAALAELPVGVVVDAFDVSIRDVRPLANAIETLAIHMRATVLAEIQPVQTYTSDHIVAYTVPTTWFDALLHTHAGSWWARRLRAPRFTEHTISVQAAFTVEAARLFPHAQVNVPFELGEPVHLITSHHTDWRRKETP